MINPIKELDLFLKIYMNDLEYSHYINISNYKEYILRDLLNNFLKIPNNDKILEDILNRKYVPYEPFEIQQIRNQWNNVSNYFRRCI